MGDALDRCMLAFHESGHAIAALRLGFTVQGVKLEPPETLVRMPPGRWRDELVVLASGDAAVRRAGGRDTAWTDEQDARAVIQRAYGDPLELPESRHRAVSLVAAHWLDIEKFAAALFKAGRLYASDVRRLSASGATPDTEMQFLMRLAMGSRTEVTR